MSKKTTGTNESLPNRLKREIEELYEPTKSELKAKHTFYHRLKNGVWSGTPKSEWTRTFAIEVLNGSVGLGKWDDPAFKAWFMNESSYEETKLASLEGAMNVINEIMLNAGEKAGDRLRAAEMALKLNKAFEEKQEGSTKGEFSEAELEALKAQGIDLKLITGK